MIVLWSMALLVPDTWPEGRLDPANAGLDPAAIAGILTRAHQDAHGDLESILIARHGCLILERYFNGATPDALHDMRSVGKSITSTLVGIALSEGAIPDVEVSMMSFFPAYASDPRAGQLGRIKVRDLLEMRSGLDADDWTSDPGSAGNESRMEVSDDWLKFAMHTPLVAAPGVRWQYSSVNSMLLGRIVGVAVRRDLGDYAREKLLAPLGITHYEWQRDPGGHVIGQGNLHLRPRDLLTIGMMLENGGRWNGRQVVPAAWVAQSTTSRVTLPVDPATGLGDLYEGYGYQWWTSRESTPFGETSVSFASGNGGQKLFIVPRFNLVVVVTSSAYNRGYAHRRAHGILRSILAAISAEEAQAGRCDRMAN
jgi:CubicO group peptidase (beta-lactamase class C family)